MCAQYEREGRGALWSCKEKVQTAYFHEKVEKHRRFNYALQLLQTTRSMLLLTCAASQTPLRSFLHWLHPCQNNKTDFLSLYTLRSALKCLQMRSVQ